MTNQQAPEIYALHTVPNKGERPWSGIYAVRADAEHDAKVLRDATGRDWSVVRLVVADTATTPTGPITRYEVVDCIDSKHVPAVIPNGAGPWVRYEDHAAALCRLHAENEALRTQQQECGNTPYDEGPFTLAHQRDTGYPPLPECDATTVGLGAVWNRHSMRAYVDADRTARTQADSVCYGYAKQIAESMWATHYKADAPHWESCDSLMGVLSQISNMMCGLSRAPADSVTAPAAVVIECGNLYAKVKLTDEAFGTTKVGDKLYRTQAADGVLEDAARWQWLADYLIGERTDLDEGIVACATIDALQQFADAARKQGGA